MKIWIDKHGGIHYHKEGCWAIDPKFPYEEVEQNFQGLGVKYIDGRWYRPCPFCFGDKRDKDE
jgi:hypothetical protein